MPMKEKMRGPPSSCEMATALFDTAAGSGLSFGSSAAFRLDPGKRLKSKRKKSTTRIFVGAAFIAEMIAATCPIESRDPDLKNPIFRTTCVCDIHDRHRRKSRSEERRVGKSVDL